MITISNILLLLFSFMCLYCIFKEYVYGKTPNITYAVISKNTYNALLIIIAVVAVFVRVFRFGDVPGGFNQDGAMAAVDSKALADYRTDRYGMFMPVHLTAWGYGQMSSLLSYMIALFVKFFGLSPITARLPQLIMSITALIFMYLFVRDTFGKKTALVAAAFAAINPWHIMQSRWALDSNLYPQFFMIGIYFLNKSINNSRKLFLVVSMVIFGLCMYCYGVSIYTMPFFLIASCVYLLYKRKISGGNVILALVIYILIALPFILTMAINFFNIDTISTPLFTIPYFKNSVRSGDILFFSPNFWEQLQKNFSAFLNTTLLQKNDLLWNDIEGFGTIYIFSIPFTILGIVTVIKEHKKSAGQMLLLFFLITGILCGIITNNVNVNRINIIYFPILILTSLGIYNLVVKVKYMKWCVFAAYLVTFGIFTSTYFTSYADMISEAFFKDFGEAVLSLKDSHAEKLYITADSQFKGSSNVSEILTLFYHETDAKYFQSEAFSDRYVFDSIENIKINPSENAEYVITSEDLLHFDKDKFVFRQFGTYYTATPKGYNN